MTPLRRIYVMELAKTNVAIDSGHDGIQGLIVFFWNNHPPVRLPRGQGLEKDTGDAIATLPN